MDMELAQWAVGGLGLALVIWKLAEWPVKRAKFHKYLETGQTAASAGNWPEAEKAFSVLTRLAPTSMEVRRAHGHALVALGQYNEAEAEYRFAANLEPRNASGHMDLGFHFALCPPRRPDEALQAFERAVELDASFRNALAETEALAHLRSHPRFLALINTGTDTPREA